MQSLAKLHSREQLYMACLRGRMDRKTCGALIALLVFFSSVSEFLKLYFIYDCHRKFDNFEGCIGKKKEHKKGIKIPTVNILVDVFSPPLFVLFIHS